MATWWVSCILLQMGLPATTQPPSKPPRQHDVFRGLDGAAAAVMMTGPQFSTARWHVQEVAKVVKNVARVLQVADRLDVPFYLGADEPLLGDPIDASYVRPPFTCQAVGLCSQRMP